MKALILLNMGGARSKEELKAFLINMFNDKNILTMNSDLLRTIIANFIVKSRLDSAWENYEKIGGRSPLHQLSSDLAKKVQKKLPGYLVIPVMRYTKPFADEAIEILKDKNIEDVTLLPLYPQFSTTTTKSSLEDFMELSSFIFNLNIIKPFYKNDAFNDLICKEIIRVQNKKENYCVIFSAHGLPQKIVDAGDPYQEQLKEQMKILKRKLSKAKTKFKSVHLAYQSKVGPLSWLEPSLDSMLEYFKGKKVIIYPISFIVDNSETVFELDIEYREIAEHIGVKKYKVCSCVNDNDEFVKIVKDMII